MDSLQLFSSQVAFGLAYFILVSSVFCLFAYQHPSTNVETVLHPNTSQSVSIILGAPIETSHTLLHCSLLSTQGAGLRGLRSACGHKSGNVIGVIATHNTYQIDNDVFFSFFTDQLIRTLSGCLLVHARLLKIN